MQRMTDVPGDCPRGQARVDSRHRSGAPRRARSGVARTGHARPRHRPRALTTSRAHVYDRPRCLAGPSCRLLSEYSTGERVPGFVGGDASLC